MVWTDGQSNKLQRQLLRLDAQWMLSHALELERAGTVTGKQDAARLRARADDNFAEARRLRETIRP